MLAGMVPPTGKQVSVEALTLFKVAGGKIVEPKTSMGPAGYYATVLDSEGNVFALYSFK